MRRFRPTLWSLVGLTVMLACSPGSEQPAAPTGAKTPDAAQVAGWEIVEDRLDLLRADGGLAVKLRISVGETTD